MSEEDLTFASYLRHFSRSVDIVDDHTFDGVRELVYRYVREDLQVSYFELMSETDVEGQPGLQTFWSSGERKHIRPIRSRDGGYSAMVALSFDQTKPLWIVNSDKAPLARAADYEDQWSHVQDLPKYVPSADDQTRTLIVAPLQRRRTLGVYYLETPSYVAITEVAKAELKLLGEALATLFELWEINKVQSQLTDRAVGDLRDILSSARFPKLPKGKPLVFVSHSDRADEDVTDIIEQVLDQFTDKIEPVYWNRMVKAGNITIQIAETITKATFGICYFSELAGEERHAGYGYTDNPNVIFEAGMLHASKNSPAREPSGWIPIREADSPPAPFDFQQERVLRVPRTNSGELNHVRFKKQLDNWIKALLGELSMTEAIQS
jgi:hypothetical protein